MMINSYHPFLNILKMTLINFSFEDFDNYQDFGVRHSNIASLCKTYNEFINFLFLINYKFKIIWLSEHIISIGNNYKFLTRLSFRLYSVVYTASHGGAGFFVHSELTYKVCDNLILTFPGEIESTAIKTLFQNQRNLLCSCLPASSHYNE